MTADSDRLKLRFFAAAWLVLQLFGAITGVVYTVKRGYDGQYFLAVGLINTAIIAAAMALLLVGERILGNK